MQSADEEFNVYKIFTFQYSDQSVSKRWPCNKCICIATFFEIHKRAEQIRVREVAGKVRLHKGTGLEHDVRQNFCCSRSGMGTAWSFYRELFPPRATFSVDDIPDLSGRVFIVTGGSSGVGKETVKVSTCLCD
jgi:hypothetical protein